MENFNFNQVNLNEFSIYYQDNLNQEFSCFISNLQSLNKDVIFANIKNDNYNVLSVAYNKDFTCEILKEYKKLISNIVKKYKLEYFKNNIKNLSLLGKMENVFLKVLQFFDEESDVIEIDKFFELTGTLFINEFYHFKLNNLRKKWNEICNLTNENNHFFESDALTIELIKFLINNIKPKHSAVLIKKQGEKVIFENQNKQLLATLNTVFLDEEFIIKIIENYSSVIMIADNVKLTETLKKQIKQMFSNQIKFLS